MALVVYCPSCGTPVEVEAYTPGIRVCLVCRTVWEMIDKPKLSWVLEQMKKDES